MAAKVIILRSNGNGLNVINDVMKTKNSILINNNSIQRSLSADILFFAYPERPSKFEKRLLNSLDTFLSLFIITPLVVAHWRGTWDFMDQYAEHFPAWNCFILGSVLHVLFTLLRETLHAEFVQSPGRKKTFKQKLRQFVVTKAYTYCFSVGCIMQWRGGWDVVRGYFGMDLRVALGMSIMCLIPLVMVKGLRNLLAVPMVIITDIKEFTFSFPTRFRTEGSRDPGLYVLDCIFSVLVVGSLVVFVWRGIWVFFDLELFPEDHKASAWGSVVIGYVVVGITFAIQPIVKWACDRLEGWWRIVVADVFLFFSFVGTINVWRGVWKLLDEYFLPENRILSDWITHGVSMILLILLNCSNSVLVRGVYIDAEEPAGQCVIFPVYYIRLFFQKERTKKQDRLLETLERQEQNNICLIEKPKANNIHIVPAARSVVDRHRTESSSGDETLLTKIINNKNDVENGNNKSDDCKIKCQTDDDNPIV